MKLQTSFANIAASAALFLACASQADAVSYTFTNITNNNPSNVDVASQLRMEVTDPGSGKVAFTFRVVGSVSATIAEIYFDDGLLGAPSITESAGVDFVLGASPADLPGGNNASPAFVASQVFNSQAAPGNANGVDASLAGTEFVTLTFGLGGFANFAAVIAKLDNPTDDPGEGTGASLRVGLHVRSIGTAEKSDSFVNVPRTSVPDGGSTLIMLGGALLACAVFSLRTRIA